MQIFSVILSVDMHWRILITCCFSGVSLGEIVLIFIVIIVDVIFAQRFRVCIDNVIIG